MRIFQLIIFLALAYCFCKNALHMFQQQHYELNRYSKWLFNKNNLKFSLTLVYILIVLLINILFKGQIAYWLTIIVSLLGTVYFIYIEIKKQYVVPLNLTNRVKRQIIVMFLLLAICLYGLGYLLPVGMLGIIAIFIPYLLIYPMFFLTLPVEESIKKYYENDARNKLGSFDQLIKIGITGSYGKTSTKNIVADILSESFLTYMTPASYNTPMGITRAVREQLKPIHEIFVCEMGADKVGDISYLMGFVKPKYGIVTSIGPQHLNTFNSIENIINEKMQVIELLPKDGVGFINLDNEYIAKYKIKNDCKVISVGIVNKKADYVAKDIKYTKDGSSFTVLIKNKNYKFKTSLLGQHNISNILMGIALAIELGVKPNAVVKSVMAIEQVEHRLQVKKINGYTFIDDAFNCNPVGSRMALDVLSLMDGKRVIVTPGMIDLGAKEDEINYSFGKYMKNKADYVILVGELQTKAIYNGLIDSKFKKENIFVVKTVRQAFDLVYGKFSTKDTILLENDLPDAFNV